MNWSQLLSSMDEGTFKDLNRAVYNEQTVRANKQAESLPDLNEEEKLLAISDNSTDAIISYRNRINLNKEFCAIDWCSIQVAKIKKDQYIESLSAPKHWY